MNWQWAWFTVSRRREMVQDGLATLGSFREAVKAPRHLAAALLVGDGDREELHDLVRGGGEVGERAGGGDAGSWRKWKQYSVGRHAMRQRDQFFSCRGIT